MHVQDAPAPEAKLVRCTRGAIFDVLLDLRPGSPSYGQWYGTELSAENGRMLYLPGTVRPRMPESRGRYRDLLHGLGVLHPSAVRGVRFDDPAFGIRWPLAARRFRNRTASGRWSSLRGAPYDSRHCPSGT